MFLLGTFQGVSHQYMQKNVDEFVYRFNRWWCGPQIDMYYYGTYAMARAAGFKSEPARIIATSAQFVDDNAASSHVNFKYRARIDQEATAHHLVSMNNY